MSDSSTDRATAAAADFKLKATALVALALHNATFMLISRYVSTRPDSLRFSTGSAVVCSEAMKLGICSCVCIGQLGGIRSWLAYLLEHVGGDPVDCLKMSVPAVMYVMQNNLFYVAIGNLDAVTCQVTDQLKLLTTALFSVLLLKRAVNCWQIGSLCVLFVGASVIQVHTLQHESRPAAVSRAVELEQNRVLGLAAALTACILSGFSGVYLELMLKSAGPRRKSLWWRNSQLAALGLVLGTAAAFAKDGVSPLQPSGFFRGYDVWVTAAVLLQGLGGLIVAVVIKYTNSILKTMATAAAIAVSCAASIQLLDLRVSPQFWLGLCLVMAAIVAYAAAGRGVGHRGDCCHCSCYSCPGDDGLTSVAGDRQGGVEEAAGASSKIDAEATQPEAA